MFNAGGCSAGRASIGDYHRSAGEASKLSLLHERSRRLISNRIFTKSIQMTESFRGSLSAYWDRRLSARLTVADCYGVGCVQLVPASGSPCERALREAAVQTLNVGGMGMLMICTASRLQGMQQFDTTYGRAVRRWNRGGAVSCGILNQAGWMQARVR